MYYKYCQNCNSYNNANNSFCLNCGQDIRNNPVYQQEPQQNYQQPVQQYYYQQAYPQNYSQNPTKSLFAKGSIISLIAGIILIISCFLPYISISAYWQSAEVSLFDATICSISLVLFGVLTIIFSFRNSGSANAILGFADLIILIIVTIFKIRDLSENIPDYKIYTKFGIGFYLVILSSICICVGGFMTKIETDKRKQ